MDGTAEGTKRVAPAAGRNRAPILEVLGGWLPAEGLVLEVASGTGEHCRHFAAALPGLVFQPSDGDPAALASIDAWAEGLPNIRPAVLLDAMAPAWPVERAAALLCINMVHIAPWEATLGLMRGAARVLPPGGLLALYGPYRRGGQHTAPGNAAFDADLRARHPAWGLRDLEAVADAAAAAGLGLFDTVAMPANNLTLGFRRR
jgi:SAM-dependent methyltransferase